MPRIPQKEGQRGSQKWLQWAVDFCPQVLQPQGVDPITWLSPRREDDFAEYQDSDFLDVLGFPELTPQLTKFWPTRGPVWDGLGCSGKTVYLVEAKAHLAEFFSPRTGASPISRAKINAAFSSVKTDLKIKDRADWAEVFYQYTNRIAHLWFLRQQKIDAKLLFVSFVGDKDMNGPKYAEEWDAAFKTADFALGLPSKHRLTKHILHVYPTVTDNGLVSGHGH